MAIESTMNFSFVWRGSAGLFVRALAISAALCGRVSAETAIPDSDAAHFQVSVPDAMIAGECPTPKYPDAARRYEAEGTTRLKTTVDPEGKVLDVEVVGKSGKTGPHRALDIAASNALWACVFNRIAEARNRTFEIDYTFTLTGAGSPLSNFPPSLVPPSWNEK